jgi:hypothetical protein
MTTTASLVEDTVHTGPPHVAKSQGSAVGIGSPEMAKKAGLRGAIVPNTMHFAQLNDLLLEIVGLDWLSGGQIEVQYRAPLYDGDDLVAKARVSSNEVATGGGVLFEVWCENQNEEPLARGTARWTPTQPTSESE